MQLLTRERFRVFIGEKWRRSIFFQGLLFCIRFLVPSSFSFWFLTVGKIGAGFVIIRLYWNEEDETMINCNAIN